MKLRLFSLPMIACFMLCLCLFLLVVNFLQLNSIQYEHVKFHHGGSSDPSSARRTANVAKRPSYTVFTKTARDGYLMHVFDMFSVYGYDRKPFDRMVDYEVIWSHEYPFVEYADQIQFTHLKPHQKVNHYPGFGCITIKSILATSGIEYIPPSFQIPSDKSKFSAFAAKNPHKMFLQKQNSHRGIKIKSIDEIDFNSTGTFIQEYIDNPLLIDGYKFDIGVYTIITSIDPLRVYIYNGDVLFRFCPEKYHPFDRNNINKYVIGDDYLPIWEVPSLKKYYIDQSASMKMSIESHLKTLGKNASKIWEKLEDAIRIVFLKKESMIIKEMKNYKSKTNFFEMIRFDFIVDNDLNVFLMEVNLSPNLSSFHYPHNRILYEQVLFNLFAIVGLTHFERKEDSIKMAVSTKNIMAYPEKCAKMDCNLCNSEDCLLCKPCMDNYTEIQLRNAYREYIDRHDCKRIFPPKFNQNSTLHDFVDISSYSLNTRLMYKWFLGKCITDSEWC